MLAGCRLRVASDVTVDRDGGGRLEIGLAADDELRDLLLEAGLDLAAEVGALGDGERWQVETVADDDATGARLVAEVDTPEGFATALDELTSGLDPDDGAVLRDLVVRVDADGGYRVEAMAGIEPPEVVGSAPQDPDAPRFDGDDLARLLAEQGDALARADLRITLPTTPTVVEGPGTVEGRSVVVRLPVDRLVPIVVTAPAPTTPFDPRLLAVGLGGLAAGAGLVLVLRSLRR